MRLAELPGYLRMLQERAALAAIPAADGMARQYETEVKKALTQRSHERPTRTPSPPGEPPAMESGTLVDSVAMVPASTPVVATSSVSPHASPRDWVQEYGLVIRAKSPGGMRFTYGDSRYRAYTVRVPERSYVRSTVDRMVADGSLSEAAALAFYEAMWPWG